MFLLIDWLSRLLAQDSFLAILFFLLLLSRGPFLSRFKTHVNVVSPSHCTGMSSTQSTLNLTICSCFIWRLLIMVPPGRIHLVYIDASNLYQTIVMSADITQSSCCNRSWSYIILFYYIVLVEEILHQSIGNVFRYRVMYIPDGAGFPPSTVS